MFLAVSRAVRLFFSREEQKDLRYIEIAISVSRGDRLTSSNRRFAYDDYS